MRDGNKLTEVYRLRLSQMDVKALKTLSQIEGATGAALMRRGLRMVLAAAGLVSEKEQEIFSTFYRRPNKERATV